MKLYKYCPLGVCKKKDSRRLTGLRDNYIWFSTFSNLNDPFEANAVYVDISSVSRATGAPEERVSLIKRWCIDHIADKYVVCSLSENTYNSMPMWAHYANNHQGFCIEYDVNLDYYTPEAVFKIKQITYRDSRKSIAPFMCKLLRFYEKIGQNGEMPKDTENIEDELDVITDENYFTKHTSWSYENEWRLFYTAIEHGEYPDGQPKQINAHLHRIEARLKKLQKSRGKLIKASEIGLTVSRIFVGLNCSAKNADSLNEISRLLGCGNAYRMQWSDTTDRYELGITRM